MIKTNKIKMIFLVLVCLIILTFVCFFVMNRKYNGEYFGINSYISETDQDNDGIDDQTDILNNTKEYIKTKPKYKSKYYATGYPNDNYGVCTDVVANALLHSGYDLRELLNEDVKKYPSDYDIDSRDKNIDFRRVNNLNVYFSKYAISLTSSIHDITEWQGGDIVVFTRHIGIVSDNRNRKGIPFLIHHANPYQLNYEENILEKLSKDIIGHYRISR